MNLDRTIHPSIGIEIITRTVDILPPCCHCSVIIGILIGIKVICIITNIGHTQCHLTIIIVISLSITFLDEASMSADYQTVIKYKRYLVNYLLTVICYAVRVKAVVILVNQEPTGLRHTFQEIHLSAGRLVPCPASKAPRYRINFFMAFIANQLSMAVNRVFQIVSPICTVTCIRFQRQAVQQPFAAIC